MLYLRETNVPVFKPQFVECVSLIYKRKRKNTKYINQQVHNNLRSSGWIRACRRGVRSLGSGAIQTIRSPDS